MESNLMIYHEFLAGQVMVGSWPGPTAPLVKGFKPALSIAPEQLDEHILEMPEVITLEGELTPKRARNLNCTVYPIPALLSPTSL